MNITATFTAFLLANDNKEIEHDPGPAIVDDLVTRRELAQVTLYTLAPGALITAWLDDDTTQGDDT